MLRYPSLTRLLGIIEKDHKWQLKRIVNHVGLDSSETGKKCKSVRKHISGFSKCTAEQYLCCSGKYFLILKLVAGSIHRPENLSPVLMSFI